MLFAVGAVFGDLTYLTLVILSLDVMSEYLTPVIGIIRVLGAMYLMYLGYLQWSSKSINIGKGRSNISNSKDIMTGYIISASNPKVMIYYLSIMPALVDINKLSLAYNAQIMLAVVIAIFGAAIVWALVGSSLRKSISSPIIAARINKTSGTVMALVGVSLLIL
jgi:threonine/homoserine/homoserine lactone efflux protein